MAGHRGLSEDALHPSALEALEGQIRPHFLFNVLTTIQTYVRDRPALAEELIGSLAQYIRTSLSRGGLVLLAEELALVHVYLGLERARLGGRLRTIFDVDPVALGVSIPSLLVQPLVENAVVHAAARRSDGATLRLAARYRRVRNRLVVMVADDGPGLVRAPPAPPGRPPQQTPGGSGGLGLGLRNVRLRLRAVYGDAGKLRLLRRCGGGTIAAIMLPAGSEKGERPVLLRDGADRAALWYGR